MTLRSLGQNTVVDFQLHALRRLLAAVAASNAFYQPILAQAGLHGNLPTLENFFRNMPWTRKAALIDDQLAYPPYGTNLTFPLDAYSRMSQTSGTSDVPLRWLDTNESWQWMLDHWKLIYAAAGVTAADCAYFAFSFGPFLGFWTAFEAACQVGCRSLPGGGLSSLGRLQAMLDNRATVLLCTPTYALRLAEVAAQESFNLARLAIRTIVVAGEPGGSVPAIRQRIEQAWPQAVVCDHHGMTEVGPVTFQQRERPNFLTVIAQSYLAEIIDPAGDRPTTPGEVGELVLTTLGRIGSPLIRYRTGDLVRQSLDQNDGTLTLQGGILGRVDDMIVVRGVNIFPAAMENLMHGMADISNYQIEIDARKPMVELQLFVEPTAAATDTDSLARHVQARVRAAFNLRIPVTVVPAGALPRGEMKTKRWLHKK